MTLCYDPALKVNRPDPEQQLKLNVNVNVVSKKKIYEGRIDLHKPFGGTTEKCKNKNDETFRHTRCGKG